MEESNIIQSKRLNKNCFVGNKGYIVYEKSVSLNGNELLLSHTSTFSQISRLNPKPIDFRAFPIDSPSPSLTLTTSRTHHILSPKPLPPPTPFQHPTTFRTTTTTPPPTLTPTTSRAIISPQRNLQLLKSKVLNSRYEQLGRSSFTRSPTCLRN